MSMMRTSRSLRRFSLVFLLALAFVAAAVWGPTTTAQRARGAAAGRRPVGHVVLISLDGFAGWALDDPLLPAPTLRRLAAEGAIGHMRPVNPTVTWPNHTTLITGVRPARHHVLFNGLLVREPGKPPRIEPWRDKKDMVRVPTLYDIAFERGLTTAQVDWVAIHNPGTITWAVPERINPQGAVEQEMVKAGLITQAGLDAFSQASIVWRDHVWTAGAAHIIRAHKPNLLMFHLLTTDSTQHRYAPRSLAAQIALANADSRVAEILRAIDAAGIRDRTTLFVVSDHGFKAVKRHIRPNALLAREGLLTVDKGKAVSGDAYVVPEGGTALAYLLRPDEGGTLVHRLRALFSGIDGIDRVSGPDDFPGLGLPRPEQTDQAPALHLAAKDGYAFTAAAEGETVIAEPSGSSGAHGYVASDPDMHALFIASGRGIRRGVTLDPIDNIDVAPTIAALLGLPLENVDGKPLTAILASPVAARGARPR